MPAPDNVIAAAEAAFDDWAITITQSAQANAVPIKQTIQRMLARGIDEQTIFDTITAGLENNAQFGRWFAEVNRHAVQPGVPRVNADIARETWGEQQLWQWQAILDDKTCQPCKDRHLMIRTEDEWLELREPTWGGTPCDDNCRCKLVPVGRATDEAMRRSRRKKGK